MIKNTSFAENVPASSSRYLLNSQNRSENFEQQHQSNINLTRGVEQLISVSHQNNNINFPVKLNSDNGGMMAPSTEVSSNRSF